MSYFILTLTLQYSPVDVQSTMRKFVMVKIRRQAKNVKLS